MNDFNLDVIFPKSEKPYTDDELMAISLENERIMEEYENSYSSGLY